MKKLVIQMDEKLCCKWQELILECILKQNFQEYWKCMEGWARSGKINKKGDVEFDCSNCSEFYSNLVGLTGIDTNSKETNLESVRKVGCCQSISMIRNLDDKVDKQKLGIWLSIFKDIMCSDCAEVVKEVSVESKII